MPGATALKKAELSLVLTDDKGIEEVNRLWRKKNRSTDVLSFPQYTVEELKEMGVQYKQGIRPEWMLGDIIISMETAKRRVEELGADLNTEVIRLFIHGLVHLFGYDHEINEKEARRMRRVERILLTR